MFRAVKLKLFGPTVRKVAALKTECHVCVFGNANLHWRLLRKKFSFTTDSKQIDNKAFLYAKIVG